MPNQKTVFSQLCEAIHPEEFARIQRRHPLTRATREFSAQDHFLAMLFAHLTHRESLRDIEACLSGPRAYHMGFRGRITRTNLAYANEHRPEALFAELTMLLIRKARKLLQPTKRDPDLPDELFAIDGSLIDLSLSLYPWARWQGSDAAVKLNLQLDLQRELPAFCALDDADRHDVAFLDAVHFQPGAYYIMDRGYLDFTRLQRIHQCGAFFVTRSKCNTTFYVCSCSPHDRSTGIRCDQHIRLRNPKSRRAYEQALRRVRYRDPETGKSLVFLTNQMDLPPLTIAMLYKRRWGIELFFRWIKQHLRLRVFLSRSPNGVKIQVWSALCAYLLVVLAKHRLGLSQNAYLIAQVVSVSAFEKVPLAELLADFASTSEPFSNSNQLEIKWL